MKKISILVVGLASLAILSFSLIKITNFFDEWDSPLGYAREDYPLGKERVYIIQENPEVNLDDGKVVKGSYYFIALPEDKESQYEASGRQIGKSDVNLEQYLGKKVHIFGNFYEGYLYLHKQSVLPPTLRDDKNVLIHISRVELAE